MRVLGQNTRSSLPQTRNMKDVSPRTKKDTRYAGTPASSLLPSLTHRWRNHAKLGKSYSRTTRRPTARQGNPGAFGSQFSADIFFLLKIIGKGFAKELRHIGLAKNETAIKLGGLAPGGFEGDEPFTSHLSIPWTDVDNTYKAYTHRKPHYDPIYLGGHGGRAEG